MWQYLFIYLWKNKLVIIVKRMQLKEEDNNNGFIEVKNKKKN